MAYKKMCTASDYFQEKCEGHCTIEDRDVIFKCCDHRGNQFLDTVEPVPLCSFHYKWLKSVSMNEVIEMKGETPEKAVDDLLEKFKINNIYRVWNRRSIKFSSGEGLLYLLQGNYDNSIPLKGDENIWELKGVFCYDAHTKNIFEIVPITDEKVMEWLMTQKIVYYYPGETRGVWLSKETGDECEKEDVSMVNGGECYFKLVQNTNEYTNVARDFEMDSCPSKIKEFFWKKKENLKFLEFQDCLNFISDEMCNNFHMIKWRELYEKCGLSDKEIFQKVYLLKEAILSENKVTIKRLKRSRGAAFDSQPCSSSEKLQFSVIMWVLHMLQIFDK
jgi:hypothetical protein